MDPTGQLVIFAIYLGGAILMGGLGVPLLLQMIPPNGLYGFRTPTTIANEEIWYPVNQVTGFWMIVYAFIGTSCSITTYVANLAVDTAAWINLAACLACLSVMTVRAVQTLLRRKAKMADSSGP